MDRRTEAAEDLVLLTEPISLTLPHRKRANRISAKLIEFCIGQRVISFQYTHSHLLRILYE